MHKSFKAVDYFIFAVLLAVLLGIAALGFIVSENSESGVSSSDSLVLVCCETDGVVVSHTLGVKKSAAVTAILMDGSPVDSAPESDFSDSKYMLVGNVRYFFPTNRSNYVSVESGGFLLLSDYERDYLEKIFEKTASTGKA